MRRIVLLVVTALMLAMAIPAYAAPADGNDNKVVNEFSFTYGIECGGVAVSAFYAEWGQLTGDNQQVQLVHVTRTYTVEGESLPFFRFVSSWVERGYENQDGDHISARSGLDEGFIGHNSFNDSTGEAVMHGQETLEPDALACEALSG